MNDHLCDLIQRIYPPYHELLFKLAADMERWGISEVAAEYLSLALIEEAHPGTVP